MFCAFIIISLSLSFQRNQAGSSTAMEYMGWKHSIEFLLGYAILITAFISDHHIKIASHMKSLFSTITHYFDIWHLKKSMYN